MAGSSSSASCDLSSPRRIDENINSTSRNSDTHQIAIRGEVNASFNGFNGVPATPQTLVDGRIPILRALRALIITAAKVSRDFHLWVMRRNNRQARYPPLIEHLLFQESMFLKLTPPVVSAFIQIIASYNPSYSLTDPSFQALVYRLLKLAAGSLLSLIVGEVHKLTIPELAVFSMLVSKCLICTSFIIVILKLLVTNIYERLLVYLAVVFLLIALVNLVVKIFRDDVREPARGEKSDVTT